MTKLLLSVHVLAAIVVPVFGFATAGSLGVMGDGWLLTSVGLTACAAAVLVLLILPGQRRLLAERASGARLAAYTGMFNILWATVTVLMIVRPGSTTGA